LGDAAILYDPYDFNRMDGRFLILTGMQPESLILADSRFSEDRKLGTGISMLPTSRISILGLIPGTLGRAGVMEGGGPELKIW
jgi:hypothetical protein